jgi:hypothetical protein
MIVNMNTTREVVSKPIGVVCDLKKRPKCVYYEKEMALADIASLREKFPAGAFYLLESVPA